MIIERLYGTAGTVAFPLIAFSTTSFHTSVTSGMFASGDVKISIDYGGFTNSATLPTADASNKMAILSLTSAELSGRHIQIYVVDQTAGKVWEDQALVIETYGTTSAQHAFNRNQTAVQASLTAAQTGVTVATVTDVTNTVKASLTAAQTGVTIATVTDVTNTVKASLTAAQTGVTIATVTDVTNTVKASLTAAQTGVTIAQVDNLGASAATQVYNQALSAASQAIGAVSLTANVTNRVMTHLDATVSSRSSHTPTQAAAAVWLATQTAYDTAGAFGGLLDVTVSGISVGSGGSSDWTDAERAYIRHALGVPGSTTSGSGGVIHSISSKVTTMPTDAASAIFAATVTSSSFNADTVGQRLTAIDNQLPGSATLSSFDPSLTTVKASLTANQTGVTVATVTDVTNTVRASLTAAQTGVTIATVTDVTNTVKASLTAAQTGVTIAQVDNFGASAASQVYANALSAASVALTNVGMTTTVSNRIDAAISSRSSHSATDAASAVFAATVTASSFNADTVGQRLTAIDNQLPGSATISSQASVDTIDDFLDTEIAAIKAKTDNLPEGVTKNAALSNFEFLMIDSGDHITPKTGLTITAQRSIDGGAFAACANSATEVSNGIYKINLAAADLNGDVITLKFTSSGADATYITIKTEA